MDNNKEVLNEAQFQKTKKGVNTVGIILIVVGVVMFIAGLIMFGTQIGKDDASFGLLTAGGMLFVFGFGVIGFGLVALFAGHGREIMAFQTQSAMPVAQEGMEKMAPSAGVAAKEIAKGIKEGINEADAEKNEN